MNRVPKTKRLIMAVSKSKKQIALPAKDAVQARLKLLDAELVRLREETGIPIGILPHGLDKLVGSFRGDADFDSAMKLGAKWRASFRPKRKVRKVAKKSDRK